MDALSPKKQKANEGARAALLSAEVYWLAFEDDADIAHLESGLEILHHWLALAGPGGKAKLRGDIERAVAQFRALLGPLQEGEAALEVDDLPQASAHYDAALSSLSAQRRRWWVGAHLSLKIGAALVSGYDTRVATIDHIEPNRSLLLSAKSTLEGWRAKKPEDEPSQMGAAIEQQLAEIQSRLDDGNKQLADAALAEQTRQAKARALEEQRREAAALAAQEAAAAKTSEKGRVLPIVLLSTGVMATAAGAGLLGEGIAFSAESSRQADAANAKADDLEQMHGDAFARERFDQKLNDYQDEARSRNLGMIVGGSALVVGGITASTVGIVTLVRRRRSMGAIEQKRARLIPSLSRSQAQLTFTMSF